MAQETELPRYMMHVGGKEVPASSGVWLQTDNPYLGKPWAEIPRGDSKDADMAVDAAYNAFNNGPWSSYSPTERGNLLRKLGELVSRDRDTLARLESTDNGKLLGEMSAHINTIPDCLNYFAGLADKVEGAVIPIDPEKHLNFTQLEPVGVVAAIVPWNAPLLLTMSKLAPALAAGCTLVIKPSEFASVSLLHFGKLVNEAGFPAGVVNILTGLGSETGTALVAHPNVAKIAFTGSDQTGQKIYEQAARDLKRVTLELGGKSANMVFEDADLDAAAAGAVAAIFAGGGQSCFAGSRLLVAESIHDRLLEKIIARVKNWNMGDPLDSKTDTAPIANEAQYNKILDYIEIARNEGGKCILGGKKASEAGCGNGWFVEPTIFDDVTNDMRIAREEVFGPVMAVIRFRDEQEAIKIANDSDFGLATGIWTTDIKRGLRVSRQMKAGVIWINTYRAVSYMSPFGGYKRSGIGRESGKDAINAYLQTKSIWISTA
jgi:(Z)-2-((N-methylformamido)methylene)-5-hydroxybutyrolactone dehydrogenase